MKKLTAIALILACAPPIAWADATQSAPSPPPAPTIIAIPAGADPVLNGDALLQAVQQAQNHLPAQLELGKGTYQLPAGDPIDLTNINLEGKGSLNTVINLGTRSLLLGNDMISAVQLIENDPSFSNYPPLIIIKPSANNNTVSLKQVQLINFGTGIFVDDGAPGSQATINMNNTSIVVFSGSGISSYDDNAVTLNLDHVNFNLQYSSAISFGVNSVINASLNKLNIMADNNSRGIMINQGSQIQNFVLQNSIFSIKQPDDDSYSLLIDRDVDGKLTISAVTFSGILKWSDDNPTINITQSSFKYPLPFADSPESSKVYLSESGVNGGSLPAIHCDGVFNLSNQAPITCPPLPPTPPGS